VPRRQPLLRAQRKRHKSGSVEGVSIPNQVTTDAKRTFRKSRLVPVNESISHVALSLTEARALGSGLRAADALIAATAREAARPLATANARHLKAIAGLEVKIFRPPAG